VFARAADWPLARLRLVATPGDAHDVAAVELELEALAGEPVPRAVSLAPAALPGGLGEHKWRDRNLIAALVRRAGAVPLIVDLDGDVLEAGYANVWVVEDDTLVTPPLDGRLLPGTLRARLLVAPPPGLEAREEPVSLERLAAADEILLTSSVRGVHPARLAGAAARFEVGALLRAALVDEELQAAAR
jgi:para-aminobenzoate synthetase/4-amino-4-deoxychorismate lyase